MYNYILSMMDGQISFFFTNGPAKIYLQIMAVTIIITNQLQNIHSALMDTIATML